MVPSVLIVDDEKHTREGLQEALAESYDVSVAANADEAFNLLDQAWLAQPEPRTTSTKKPKNQAPRKPLPVCKRGSTR